MAQLLTNEDRMNAKLFVTFLALKLVESAPGSYLTWREKLPFNPGDPIPDCKDVCYAKCGPEHKGVSICNSFLEAVDEISEDFDHGNATTTAVSPNLSEKLTQPFKADFKSHFPARFIRSLHLSNVLNFRKRAWGLVWTEY